MTLPVEVPSAKTTDDAPAVEITMPVSSGNVKVEIPVEKVTPGTVAVLVHADGTESVVSTTQLTGNGVALNVSNDTVLKVVDNAKDFDDVRLNDWERNAVDFVSARGLVNGVTADGKTFDLDGIANREQIWTMLARLDGVDTTPGEGETWADKGRQWAMEKKISDGTNGGDKITREQLVTMLWRLEGEPTSAYDLGTVSDHADTSDWAVVANSWAVETGVMHGNPDGTLAPQDKTTRGQLAQFMMNYIQST